MHQYIAFLRAINVGGHNVKMAALRELFIQAGLTDAQTFIASGNVWFTSNDSDTRKLQQQLEEHLADALGYTVKTFIRSSAEVAAIAAYQPFDQESLQTAGALNIAFLQSPLDVQAQRTLKQLETDIDRFHYHQREVYWLCAVKQSQSKFSNSIFEKALNLCATFRGMNTIRRLSAKYPVA